LEVPYTLPQRGFAAPASAGEPEEDGPTALVRIPEPVNRSPDFGTGKPSPDRVVECFRRYMDHDGAAVSRAELEANLAAKLASTVFLEDLHLLIPPGVQVDPAKAAEVVKDELIAKLPGEPWKGPGT
jgi:hypothetical protein